MLNDFIKKSELVGNKNEVLDFDSMKKYLDNNDYEFIFLPSFKLKKVVDIDKEGISSAIVEADYGIAETGTVVIDSKDILLRKATCLAERLDIVLFKSKILKKLEDISSFIKEKTENDGYIAFITGASRTADIERVLTIGVHGPCETNIFIIEDK